MVAVVGVEGRSGTTSDAEILVGLWVVELDVGLIVSRRWAVSLFVPEAFPALRLRPLFGMSLDFPRPRPGST